MLDQAQPCQFCPGTLKNPSGDAVLAFHVCHVGHYVLGPFQFEKDACCRTLLVAVDREEHLDKFGEVRKLGDSAIAKVDLREFRHVTFSPLPLG